MDQVLSQLHGQLLTALQVSRILGVPVSTVEAWRRLRIGPPAVRASAHQRYFAHELAAWIADGGPLEYGICLDVLPGVRDDLPFPVRVHGDPEQLGA